jgi:hypothetical protein
MLGNWGENFQYMLYSLLLDHLLFLLLVAKEGVNIRRSIMPPCLFVFQRVNCICNFALFFPFYFPFAHLHSFGSWSFVKQSGWFFQVLGNAKGAVAVVVSILIFRNPVSVTGMLGYSLTVLGVILYSEAKKRSK